MIIYKITNLVNGKVYIGQTTMSLDKRWNTHCNRKNRPGISVAIQKYSKENFTIEEIDGANSLSELNYLEEHYIYIHNSMAPNGYNILPGGRNSKHTEETKQKMRKQRNPILNAENQEYRKRSEVTKQKISKANKGRVLTEEHRRKIGEKSKGHKVTDEQKLAISKANKGHKYNIGRKVTKEARENMSRAQKGRIITDSHRKKMSEVRKGFTSDARKKAHRILTEQSKIKVIAINLKTNQEILFNSLKEAGKYTTVYPGNISKILSGKILKSKDWTFKRYE